MIIVQKGRFRARTIDRQADRVRAHGLRAQVFATDCAGPDWMDPICEHVVVEETATRAIVATFRLLHMNGGGEIARSYSARFYGLDLLTRLNAPMMEVGRFCVAPGPQDFDILRVAWGAIARLVDARGVALLFGCASFPGACASDHVDALAWLRAHHVAPARWRPRLKAADTVAFDDLPVILPDMRRAMMGMPPLLRTYLGMGGWVSDHAVIDREMGTTHVFTGVEIAAIPPARARLLRAVAS